MSEWATFFEDTASERNLFNHCINKRRLIELVVAHTPKGGRILEAGCGTAMLSVILADQGFRVTALDLSEDVLEYGKKWQSLERLHLEMKQGDLLNLRSAFEAHAFDTVCHSGVMEHFSDEDIVKSLSEQRAISRRVIFNVPNHRNVLTDKHFGNERFLNNRKWVSLIQKAGFRKIKVHGGYDLTKLPYFVLPGIFFHKRASFWWKHFSRHSIFVCEE